MKHRRPHRPTPKPARSALVQIEKPIYGGAFLARLAGKATFVPLTLPGEQARIRIIEDKHSYAAGEPEEILTPSPTRVQPRCPHFGMCGGCSYQHADYETQLALKQQILRETFQRAGVEAPAHIEVLAAQPWAYRNRIRLAFDPSGRVGYRARRSHDITPIQECPIASPLLVKAALSASELIREHTSAFKPSELSLFMNADATALLAGLYVRTSAMEGFNSLAAAWSDRIPELAGIECVLQSSAEEPSKQLARWGRESIAYQAAGFGYRVDHGSFFQVNRWLIDALIEEVVAGHQGTLAWDLFAGVGLFARQLASRFGEVIAVESAPASLAALTQNLQGTTGHAISADTLSFLRSHQAGPAPDLIVVDPPRAGFGPEVTTLLATIAAPTIVYVSCDPSTLARDLKQLVASGYAILSVTLADLFPQTFHLETVVTLQKP
ncbi:23S rRNA (uracil(1939)-C(5))-methyltransferase RlmD [Occallatibacter savannae]|uniref:23S rRNA (uracil(1939)-C(5))-methyltransferase RlmD n=1 Tax=Occallatibacter savannae TaxID=1002691 RepID=UPI000D68B6F4|nr:23S rRNA (uracil(1939)-C(5))-methyltransferase RlmD [Occallatibacter savannae]